MDLLRKGLWICKDYLQVKDMVRITFVTVTLAVNKSSLARKGKKTHSTLLTFIGSKKINKSLRTKKYKKTFTSIAWNIASYFVQIHDFHNFLG